MRTTLATVLILLCLSACTPKLFMHSYTFDLSKYSAAGIFITESNSVNFDYVPIGLVQTVGGGAERTKKGAYTTFSQQDVFDAFVEECRSKGANAIINVDIKQMPDRKDNIAYLISGMAVKRK